MNLTEYNKNKIFSISGLKKTSNPNDERLTFISDNDKIRLDKVKTCKIWLVGDGDELLNLYRQRQTMGFNDNPIYNQNGRNYFWSQSSQECAIKRIHSGIPNAIAMTLTNIVGFPMIQTPDDKVWDKIVKENNFKYKLTQQARPLTLAQGYGSWKINFNKDICDVPTWEYYDAENVEYVIKCGLLFGIIYKSYYKDQKGKDYVLEEFRYRKNGNAYIEYELFRLGKNDEIEKVKFDCIPELKGLENGNIVIPGLNKVLGVKSEYFFDPLNVDYGKSIFDGKLDLFDMLDEILSQASQTNRVSTPVEYYSPDVLQRGANGEIGLPNLYNRQFIQKAGTPDGEGNLNQDVITTQPELNFDKYGMLAKDVLDYIFTGVLSPATLGIDVAKKDNADAQREKEKISIMTRNNIIDRETEMIKDIVTLSFMVYEYMKTGSITIQDYDITVKYDEFANPSEEIVLQTLLPAVNSRAMSPELFVDKVYGDSLSIEDKQKEIEFIKEQMKAEDVDLGGLLGETGTNESMGRAGETENELEDTEEPVSI